MADPTYDGLTGDQNYLYGLDYEDNIYKIRKSDLKIVQKYTLTTAQNAYNLRCYNGYLYCCCERDAEGNISVRLVKLAKDFSEETFLLLPHEYSIYDDPGCMMLDSKDSNILYVCTEVWAGDPLGGGPKIWKISLASFSVISSNYWLREGTSDGQFLAMGQTEDYIFGLAYYEGIHKIRKSDLVREVRFTGAWYPQFPRGYGCFVYNNKVYGVFNDAFSAVLRFDINCTTVEKTWGPETNPVQGAHILGEKIYAFTEYEAIYQLTSDLETLDSWVFDPMEFYLQTIYPSWVTG